MTQPAPKRYAHSLIRHFILIAIFFPAFYSYSGHAFYPDLFLASILALMFVVNIWSKWRLDVRRHAPCVLSVGILLLLYNIATFYSYRRYGELYSAWKFDQIHVTVAFLFFLSLLLVKDYQNILSHKVIKLTIYVIVINNLIGLLFRLKGYSRLYMMNFSHELAHVDPVNAYFSWIYYDIGEYALILLLSMAFFIVYRDHFRNQWTFALSMLVLLAGMYLTKSVTFYMATAILLGGALIQHLLQKYQVADWIIRQCLPIPLLLYVFAGILLFSKVESFQTKLLIWQGNWDILINNLTESIMPFGGMPYEVPGVDRAINQAHNVFLNHMLFHSMPVGILFALLFVAILVCSFLRRPDFRTMGFWLAVLIPMILENTPTTLNLALVLFFLYMIFFRPEKIEISDSE